MEGELMHSMKPVCKTSDASGFDRIPCVQYFPYHLTDVHSNILALIKVSHRESIPNCNKAQWKHGEAWVSFIKHIGKLWQMHCISIGKLENDC